MYEKRFELPKKPTAEQGRNLAIQAYWDLVLRLREFLRERYGEEGLREFIQWECGKDALLVRGLPGKGAQKHTSFVAFVSNVFNHEYEVVEATEESSTVIITKCGIIPIANELSVDIKEMCYNDAAYVGPNGIFKHLGLETSVKVGPPCVFKAKRNP